MGGSKDCLLTDVKDNIQAGELVIFIQLSVIYGNDMFENLLGEYSNHKALNNNNPCRFFG